MQLRAFDLMRRRFQDTPALASQLIAWIWPVDVSSSQHSDALAGAALSLLP